MVQRSITERERPVFSASAVLDTVAADLSAIRIQDKLTFGDIAAVINKSEDQAAKYCAGSAEMGIVAFARAEREWNGRFAGGLHRLCHDSRPDKHMDGDRARESKVLKAALALSIALSDDEEISPSEVRDNRKTIEDARDALDELLGKLVRAA